MLSALLRATAWAANRVSHFTSNCGSSAYKELDDERKGKKRKKKEEKAKRERE